MLCDLLCDTVRVESYGVAVRLQWGKDEETKDPRAGISLYNALMWDLC